MNATNNGYLGFDNVRIPREQMLMKNAQVLEVRNAVIIWGWYGIMLVMQILSMHMYRHPPPHTQMVCFYVVSICTLYFFGLAFNHHVSGTSLIFCLCM